MTNVKEPEQTGDETPVSEAPPSLVYCSFCGKDQYLVGKLIAGPSVQICDECVCLCVDIIREEGRPDFARSSA